MNYFYFAYGSNMSPQRIRSRMPHARVVGPAYLKGWVLKERLYADIERARGGQVNGLLFVISDYELRTLDCCEGYPDIYTSFGVDCYLDEKHKVYALTYAMTPQTKVLREGKPYPVEYRRMCSAGARIHGVKDDFGWPE